MRKLMLLLVMASCASTLDDPSAILPLSELGPSAPPSAKPFAPTAKDIARFRGALPSTVPPAIASRTSSYYGQFIGYVDAKGQRWVHGNFMCRLHEDEKHFGRDLWRHKYIAVNDGGDCYFHVEWSPDTNTTRALSVNGDA